MLSFRGPFTRGGHSDGVPTGLDLMPRRLRLDVLVVATLAAVCTVALQGSDTTSRPDSSDTMLAVGQSWDLKLPEPAEIPGLTERKVVRIVYQPLVASR